MNVTFSNKNKASLYFLEKKKQKQKTPIKIDHLCFYDGRFTNGIEKKVFFKFVFYCCCFFLEKKRNFSRDFVR